MLKDTANKILSKHPLLENKGIAEFISSQNEYLGKYFNTIDIQSYLAQNSKFIHFTSNGRFALHDIIYFFLQKTGTATVRCSSLSVSEIAARLFIRAFDKQLLNELHLYLNDQKKRHSAKAVQLLHNKAAINYTDIHAKVATIQNNSFHVTVLSSSNLTRNQNKEFGLLFFDKQTFDFYHNFLCSLQIHK